MKKTFTFLFLLVSIGLLKAQLPNIKVWTLNPAGTATVAVVNLNDTIKYTVAANATKTVKIRYQNTSTTTNTYTAARYDMYLNATGTSTTNPIASAYFCFGNLGTCFPPTTTVCPSSEYDIVPKDSVDLLVTDLDEADVQWFSQVKYKIYNVNNTADAFTFFIKYNPTMSSVGINELSSIESTSDVYPNPSANNASIALSLKSESDVKLQVYNALGSLVQSNPSQKYPQGKHKLTVDCANFNNGFYFMTITAGDSKITKRFVVSK